MYIETGSKKSTATAECVLEVPNSVAILKYVNRDIVIAVLVQFCLLTQLG